MKMTIACYGVRDYEIETFKTLGAEYGYDLVLSKEYITDSNYRIGLGYKALMVRGNCNLGRDSLKALKEGGLVYLLTRTVGYNHIDLEACKEFGIACARVPSYSPNSVAELAVTYIMALNRNLVYTTGQTARRDFRVTDAMFSPEIRNLTVGILGCGRIGLTVASYFKGMGAKVIGYDIFQNEFGRKILDAYVDIPTLQKEADVISVHMPYFKGKNDFFVNEDFIDRMKDKSILVNTARGELVDPKAVIKAVTSGKLRGVGLDVVCNEGLTMNKAHIGKMEDPDTEALVSLYPKVLMSPHIGSATDEALKNMVEISLQNLDEYLKSGNCKNSLIK